MARTVRRRSLPVDHEVRSAVRGDKPLVNFIYGLGGRDLSLDEVKDTFRALAKAKKVAAGKVDVRYIGVRE